MIISCVVIEVALLVDQFYPLYDWIVTKGIGSNAVPFLRHPGMFQGVRCQALTFTSLSVSDSSWDWL
jgi:hypothetical protein